MASPECIEPIIQRDGGDCGIACLAMLLQRPYREVSEVAIKAFKQRPHTHGLELRQIKSLARKFGHSFKSVHPSQIDLHEETGILVMNRKNGEGHVAVVFEGIIVDPADGLIYTPEAYLAFHGVKLTRFLKI